MPDARERFPAVGREADRDDDVVAADRAHLLVHHPADPVDELHAFVDVLQRVGHVRRDRVGPPHKHDTDAAPRETQLEETYYHRLNPGQGFAFQRVYTDDRSLDESLAVEDRDVVMVPRGYHPVVVPHGYESYYLNVMAGPKREWHFHNDPAHEWMLKR